MSFKLLRHATTDERNAAYNAGHRLLVEKWIPQLPGFFQGQARQKLDSADGVTGVLEFVDAVLEAAEAKREEGEAKA